MPQSWASRVCLNSKYIVGIESEPGHHKKGVSLSQGFVSSAFCPSIHPMGPKAKRRSSSAGSSGSAAKKSRQSTLTAAGRVQPPAPPRGAPARPPPPPPDQDWDREDSPESQPASEGNGGKEGRERGRDGEEGRADATGDVDALPEGIPKPKNKGVTKRPPSGCYASGAFVWVKNAITGEFLRGEDGKKQTACRLCQAAIDGG